MLIKFLTGANFFWFPSKYFASQKSANELLENEIVHCVLSIAKWMIEVAINPLFYFTKFRITIRNDLVLFADCKLEFTVYNITQ